MQTSTQLTGNTIIFKKKHILKAKIKKSKHIISR